MLPTSTRIPQTVDALAVTVAAAMPSWQLIDGPPAGRALEDDVVFLAAPDADGLAISGDVTRQDGLSIRYAEVFSIRCVISSESGDGDVKALRDRVAAGFTDLDAALKADPSLGGAVDRVGLGPSVQWGVAPEGTVVEVVFQIVGSALL